MTLVISKGLTLDNGTRAAAIAGVSPMLDYRFAREKREIETVSLTDKLTFTGGNEGTFVGSDGFIQQATTNVPRFDHDPLSRRSLGLLSEVSRENLTLESEDLSNGWISVNTNVVFDGTLSPNGGNKSNLLTATSTASNSKRKQQNFTISAGQIHTLSAFFKIANTEINFAGLSLTDSLSASTYVTARWNLETGENTLGEASSGFTYSGQSIKDYGNGWYLCSVSGIISTATGLTIVLYGATSGTAIGGNLRGAQVVPLALNEAVVYAWGAQLEAASTPSTYIPTTSAAVTRTADSAVIDGTGVITGTYTMVEKPAGCAVVSGTNINLQPGFTAERVMVFPAALDAGQITAIRGAM